jgi:tetratricopeptide (TPR) repeat protein
LRAFEPVDPDVGFWRKWIHLWRFKSWAHQLAAQYPEGLEAAREGLRRFPEDPELTRLEIRALAAMDRTAEIDSLLEGLSSFPPGQHLHEAGLSNPGFTLRTLAGDLSRLGYGNNAEEVARRSLVWYRAQPQGAYAQELGEALLVAGRTDEALAHFEALIEETPDSLDAHGGYGVALAMTGDETGAQREARWLGELDRPYLRGRETLWRARIAAQLGAMDESVELLRQALQEGRIYYIFLYDTFLMPLWGYGPFEALVVPKG